MYILKMNNLSVIFILFVTFHVIQTQSINNEKNSTTRQLKIKMIVDKNVDKTLDKNVHKTVVKIEPKNIHKNHKKVMYTNVEIGELLITIHTY